MLLTKHNVEGKPRQLAITDLPMKPLAMVYVSGNLTLGVIIELRAHVSNVRVVFRCHRLYPLAKCVT